MRLAGLDIGTTGCKCTVFDSEGGAPLGQAYRSYPARRGQGGHEIDTGALMGAVHEVIGEMAAQYPDIAALGVTAFGEAFVLTDGAGEALNAAIIGSDPRGQEECEELEAKAGGRRLAAIAGARFSSMYSLPKIMWLKKHRPDMYARAAYIFLIGDYVAFRLTGQRRIDYSLAVRSLGLDITTLEWSEEIFAAAGLDSAMMSEPVPTGAVAGEVTARAAASTGLKAGTPVVLCGLDQVAVAVGAGVFDPSLAVDGAGTVECLTPMFQGRPDPGDMYDGYYSVTPYVKPDTYVVYAFSYTGGALIEWCADTLAKKEKELAGGLSVNQYLEKRHAEARGQDAPTGLMVLPHFAGAATPYMDSGSRGAIVGLTLDTTVEDIYVAAMEGVAYEMRLNLERLGASAKNIASLRATGGGAKSALWAQMKADVLNLPITALETSNAGTVGSAMLTGRAIGVFKDLEEAAGRLVKTARVYGPRPAMHEKYMAVYERYKKLYQAVRPLV